MMRVLKPPGDALRAWLILLLLAGSASAAVPTGAMQQSGGDSSRFSDEQIDAVGQGVLESIEFRSLRRRVLEQKELTPRDRGNGFLVRSLEWMGEQVRWVFQQVGDFLGWLWSGLWGSPGRPARPLTPAGTGEGWLSGLLDGDWFGMLESMSGLAKFLAIVLLVAVVGLVALVVARIIRSRDQRRVMRGLFSDAAADPLGDLQVPPGELPAATYEGRARQLAEEGNYRAAIRELLLGSMAWIERAGLIRYRRGLTNRDYVRSVWRELQKRQAYLVTAGCFERVYFGRRPATLEMFERCLEEFEGAFREEKTQPAAV